MHKHLVLVLLLAPAFARAQMVVAGGEGTLTDTAGQQITLDGTKFSKQLKPIIDARDVVGVDCTGRKSSGLALSALNFSGYTLSLARCAKIRIDGGQPWIIYGRKAAIIDGGNKYGYGWSGVGPLIFGCNGGSGAVVQFNRSSNIILRNLAIQPSGGSLCGGAAGAFTQSVSIDNTVVGADVGGVTGTNLEIEYSSLSASAGVNGYTGIYVSGAQNLELMKFHDNDINCQNSPGSYGIRVLSGNSQNNLIAHNNLHRCMWGIHTYGPEQHIVRNNFDYTGTYSVFGGGASLFMHSGLVNDIRYNAASEGTGQFFTTDNTGGAVYIFEGNGLGGTDAGTTAPGSYMVDLGTSGCGGKWIFKNANNGANYNNPSLPVIGCSAAGAVGLAAMPPGAWIDDDGTNLWGGTAYQAGIPQGGFNSPALNTHKEVTTIRTFNSGSNPQFIQSPSRTERASRGSASAKDIVRAAVAQDAGDPVAWTITALGETGAPTSGAIATNLPFVGGLQTAAQTVVLRGGTGNEAPWVTPRGAAGATNWAYQVTCVTGGGTVRTGGITAIANGAATLTAANYNEVSFYAQPGCVRYDFYRTMAGGTPNTLGKIGSVNVNTWADDGSNHGSEQVYWNDTGLTGDATPAPATNADGRMVSAGPVIGTQLQPTATTGTAPATTSSTTVVKNWNSDMVDGKHAADFTLAPVTPPAHSTDACTAGAWAYDARYLYMCYASRDWRRIAWTSGTW